MGLFDRDWYWQKRAERNSPDDDYLFPNRRWPGRKTTVYPTVLAVLAVLALLVFGLDRGWFDHDRRSRAELLKAENDALRGPNSDQPPVIRPPKVAAPPVAPRVDTFYDKHWMAIDIALVGLTVICPIVLLLLLVFLFIRGLRGPALIGLLLGFVAANASGGMYMSGSLFRWGVLRPADSMGGAFQFFMVIIAAFTITAIAGTVAGVVFTKVPAPSE